MSIRQLSYFCLIQSERRAGCPRAWWVELSLFSPTQITTPWCVLTTEACSAWYSKNKAKQTKTDLKLISVHQPIKSPATFLLLYHPFWNILKFFYTGILLAFTYSQLIQLGPQIPMIEHRMVCVHFKAHHILSFVLNALHTLKHHLHNNLVK